MPDKPARSPLESEIILRKFSILFVLMATLPMAVVVYFYNYLKGYGYGAGSIGIIVALIVIGLTVGYWGMRVVLKDLVNVVKLRTETLKVILGTEKFDEVTQGGNEITILVRTFDEVIKQLEENISQLESTKKTLHSVLKKVSKGLASHEDIDTFLALIIETVVDALGAKTGALLLLDDEAKALQIKSTFNVPVPKAILPAFDVRKGKLGSVIQTRKAAFISDFEQDEHAVDLKEVFGHPPVLCAPLLFQDHILGVLAISLPSGQKLKKDELNLLSNIALQTAVAIENERLNVDAEKTYFETIAALALAVEAKDPYSRGHLDRVADYALRIGRKMGLPEEDLATLRDAAKLHDVGKIGVLDEILCKPSKLDEDEKEIMRKHVNIGEGIISPIRSLRKVCEIVRHHHEFLDGSGYPDRLQGEQINLLTRILTAADIYDALVTTRPYRQALPREKAHRILIEDFLKKLDQGIVKILFEVV